METGQVDPVDKRSPSVTLNCYCNGFNNNLLLFIIRNQPYLFDKNDLRDSVVVNILYFVCFLVCKPSNGCTLRSQVARI